MPNDNLKISVVMCTYNGILYIEEQLKSIFDQTLLPDEIIISDDGSVDGTLQAAEEYINLALIARRNLAQIRFKFSSNHVVLGVTRNFEKAVKSASFDLIALADQDDIWYETRLEQIYNQFLIDEKLVLVHSNADLVDGHNQHLNHTLFDALGVTDKEIDKVNSGQGSSVLLRRNIVTGATTVFRKRLLTAALPFPSGLLHDEWLAFVATYVGALKVIEKPLIRYRQHANNQIGAKRRGLRHSLGRVFYPRTERNFILLSRAQSISRHPFVCSKQSLECTLDSLGKLKHELVRSNFPKARIRRICPVLKELKTGRYNKYGLGFQDVVRDVLQPV